MAMDKIKENGGVDPVTLSRGYTPLDGDPPNSGESISKPQHVAEDARAEKMMQEMGYDLTDREVPIGGFLEREIPAPYSRPRRTSDEDQG